MDSRGFQQFCVPPTLPEDRVLYSGAVFIPGSFDHRGSPLVIFPRAQHNKLISDLKQEDVVELLKYFHLHLCESQTSNGLVSTVTDLRSASLDVVSIIINSLLQFQHEFGRVVDTFYAVQPQVKGVRKHVLKSLGLGRSKQCSKPSFKCVLLNEMFELFNYIDRSQLPCDLGGYLIYQHKAWVHFTKEIDGFVREYFALAQRFPGCSAILQKLSLQPLPTVTEELEQLSQHIEELRTAWRRDLGIDDLLRKCEEILEKFRDPKCDPCFNAMAGTTQFQQAADDFLKKNARIREAVKKVEFLWQQALTRAQHSLKELRTRERTKQITDLIVSEGLGKIRSYKLEIANNLSQAEILKLDYDAAIYNPAMRLIAESEKLLQDIDKITEPGLEAEDYKEKLSRLKDMFHIAVELPRQTLKAVYDFYDIFEKVASWYHVLLQEVFFKEALCDHAVHDLRFPHKAFLCLKPSWQDHVHRFLNKAPLPTDEELVRLENLADCIPDMLHRKRGKLLSHQCSVLRKLLTSLGQVQPIDLEQAVQWQEAYLKALQNLLGPPASSSIDIGNARGAAQHRKSAAEHVMEEKYTNRSLYRSDCFELWMSSSEKPVNETDPIQHGRSGFISSHIDQRLQLSIPSAYEMALECPIQEGKELSKRPPSLSSFDSGIDGTGIYNLETVKFNYEITNREQGAKKSPNSSLITESAKLNEDGTVGGVETQCPAIEEFEFADFSSISSEVQPVLKSDPNALNFEIKVSRSASLPKNPWVSLSVEDLEKSYVVTISPKKSVLESQRFKHVKSASCDVVDENEERQVNGFCGMTPTLNKLSLTKTMSAVEKEPVLVVEQSAVHMSERFKDPECCEELNLSPSKNVENLEDKNPELPYNSYEFCGSRMLLEGSGSERKQTEPTTYDWDIKEQEMLQDDVEKLLLKTAKILDEEESVLRQENELELLLQLEDQESSDDPEENHSISKKHQGTTTSGKMTMSMKELSEAGVIGLEEYLWSETGQDGFHSSCMCPHLPCDSEHEQEERSFKRYTGACSANCNTAPSVTRSHWAHQNDSRLLQELEELNQIEDRILEENLKIRELCCPEEDLSAQIPIPHVSNANDDRVKFLMELERERKEVEKMEQSLAREEKMKCKNLKKQPQISSRTKSDNQNKSATKSSTCEAISHLKANPVVEFKKHFILGGRNLKSNDICKTNASDSGSSQAPVCLKRSLVKLQTGHSTKRATKTVHSKKFSLQDEGLGLTRNNIVSRSEKRNQSCTIDSQIFIPPPHNETCVQSDKIDHQINNGISGAQVESKQGMDDPELFGLANVCKGQDSVDAEAIYFSPVEGDILKSSTLQPELERSATLVPSAHSPENEIIESNENYSAACKSQKGTAVQTKEKPKPALRTSVPIKVEKLPAGAVSLQYLGNAKCDNKDQQRLPVPKPRKSMKSCQTESCREPCLEDSSPFGKHAETADVSAFVGTCSVSKESKTQMPMTAGPRHKSQLSLQIKDKSQVIKKDIIGKTSANLSDSPVNFKIEQVDCRNDNSITEASSLSDSTENRKTCSWGEDSKLVKNGNVCDEGKSDAQHILFSNEIKQEASAICSSILESREDCVPEMLHCIESRNIGTRKDSVHMTDPSYLHDFPNQDVHPIFEDCRARVSVTFNPAMNAHTFQASVIKLACDYKTPIVLDTGSGLIKAGFADQQLPTAIFPTVIGRPKYENICNRRGQQDIYIGHDAQHMRGVLSLNYPLEHGIVTNWDEIEQIWHHTFNHQLHVDPEEHPVLLTEPAMNPHHNRERMVEILFEAFNVPLTFVAMQAVLALYSAGQTTGLILDSGDGVTHTVPVYEGYNLPHAIQRLNLAGRDLTDHLKKLLKERGYSFNSTAEREIVRDIKEKHCYVAGDYDAELRSPETISELHYTLPDGQIISMGDEMFRVPEILFRPELIGKDHYGIHESLLRSIILCDVDLRKTFVANIILSGGNTMLTGLPARIQKEISSMVPLDLSEHVHVTSPANRDFTVWSGGATLASSSALDSAWISREEYHEFGPKIVHRKCF
ncbi:uncharacterized protein [Narcine bancroftii]|uniref:uncharacterized protein isoform X2 n=1 Tax=Narcine bancroftii TaxID=1343680 RepID=UPI0038317101